jgi:hypothetical protein
MITVISPTAISRIIVRMLGRVFRIIKRPFLLNPNQLGKENVNRVTLVLAADNMEIMLMQTLSTVKVGIHPS